MINSDTPHLFRNYCVQTGWISTRVSSEFEARVADLLKAAHDAGRRIGMEEAAKVCDGIAEQHDMRANTPDESAHHAHSGQSYGASECADAIRAAAGEG